MPLIKAIVEYIAGYKEFNPNTRCLTRPSKSRRQSDKWKGEPHVQFAIGKIPTTDYNGKRRVHFTPRSHSHDQEYEDEGDIPPPNVPGPLHEATPHQGDGNANYGPADQCNNTGQGEARSRHGGSQHGDPRHRDPHHEGPRHAGFRHAGPQHGNPYHEAPHHREPHHEGSRHGGSRHEGSRRQGSRHGVPQVYSPAQQNIPAPHYQPAQQYAPAHIYPLAAPEASASSHDAAPRRRSTAHRAPTLREPTIAERESLKVHMGIDPYRREPAGHCNIRSVQDWELASSCYSHNEAPSQAPSRMSTPPSTTVPDDSVSMRGSRGRNQTPAREPAPDPLSVAQGRRYEGPSSARHKSRSRSRYPRTPESAYEGRSLTGHRSTSRSRHPLVPEGVLNTRYTDRDIPSSYGGSSADHASTHSESQISWSRHRSPYHSESGCSRRASDPRHSGRSGMSHKEGLPAFEIPPPGPKPEGPSIGIYASSPSSHHGPSSRVETLSSSKTSVQGLARKAQHFTHHG